MKGTLQPTGIKSKCIVRQAIVRRRILKDILLHLWNLWFDGGLAAFPITFLFFAHKFSMQFLSSTRPITATGIASSQADSSRAASFAFDSAI